MMPIRALALLVLCVGAQDQVVQLILTTKDGHRIVGIPSIESLKIENSLGKLDLNLRKFMKLKFEGDTVAGTAMDGSSLKGVLLSKTVSVKTLLGDLEIPTSNLKEADIQFAFATAPFGRRQPGEILLMIRTKDGNDLIGTTDLLKIPFESSIAKFVIDIKDLAGLTRTAESHVLALQDGSQIRGTSKIPAGITIKSSVGDFTIKPEDISAITFRGTRPVEQVPPSGPPAASGPAPQLEVLKPTQRVEVQDVLGDLRISKDGKRLYAINLSDNRLYRWKLPSLEEDGSATLSPGVKALSLDPTGDWAIAAGHTTITLLTTEPLAVRKSFAVELSVEDVHALDKDTLLVSGSRDAALVSVPKTAVVQLLQGRAQKLTPSPAGDRVYAGELIFSVRKESGEFKVEKAGQNYGQGFGDGGRMSISPDGRYGCTPLDARVFRLGRCWSAARVQVVQLDPRSVTVFSKDSDRLFLFTEQGYLKVHGCADWQISASHSLGIHATQAVLEPDGKSIVVAGWVINEPMGRGRSGQQNPGRAVNLFRFELPR
jgi:hypothetical protein